MQFMEYPQRTTKKTTRTIFSGRAAAFSITTLRATARRRGGGYSSFLDHFPNTHTHTVRERGQIGPLLDAVAAGQLYGCGGEGGREGAGGREIERLISTAGGRVHTAPWRRPSKAPARLRDFALCWMFFSLASTGFLEHLTMPTDGALSTKCFQTPSQ